MPADASLVSRSPSVANASAPAARLDETMLAMDVVDTIRHAQGLVERELGADQREAALKQRLREIYGSQGIDVPDRLLDEGVAALQQNRFVYRPTQPSFARSLATVWATRARWGRPAALGVVALLLIGCGWWFGVHLPAQAARVAQQQELSTGLPKALQAETDRVLATTQLPDRRAQAEYLLAEGQAAARAGSLTDGRARLAALQALQRQLSLAYTVRIVSRPGTPSGVWRVATENARARNFYLIVEALDVNGRPVSVPITSEENGQTKLVSQWGLRVSPETFDRVRQDKMQNGVLQDPIVGNKQAGEYDTSWSIPTNGGSILAW